MNSSLFIPHMIEEKSFAINGYVDKIELIGKFLFIFYRYEEEIHQYDIMNNDLVNIFESNIFAIADNFIFVVDNEINVKQYDFRTGKEVRTFVGNSNNICKIKCVDEFVFLITREELRQYNIYSGILVKTQFGSYIFADITKDKHLFQWIGQCIIRQNLTNNVITQYDMPYQPIMVISEKYLFAIANNRYLYKWNIGESRPILIKKREFGFVSRLEFVNGYLFSSDIGGRIHQIDIETLECINTLYDCSHVHLHNFISIGDYFFVLHNNGDLRKYKFGETSYSAKNIGADISCIAAAEKHVIVAGENKITIYDTDPYHSAELPLANLTKQEKMATIFVVAILAGGANKNVLRDILAEVANGGEITPVGKLQSVVSYISSLFGY